MPHKNPRDPRRLAQQAAWRVSPAGRRSRDLASSKTNGHNVALEGRVWMLEQQGGACAMIGCDDDAVCVDHDHEDGHIRGLLCINCNVALGKFGDNVLGLTRALQYVSH